MLFSLFLTLESGSVIISYSDIVYNLTIVEKLINCENDSIGENKFNELKNYKKIVLDCKIKILKRFRF